MFRISFLRRRIMKKSAPRMFPNVAPANTAAIQPASARGDDLEHRLLLIQQSLLAGATRPAIIALAQATWGVSRRTANWYILKVLRRVAANAKYETRDFVQQLTQMQRNNILEKILGTLY